MELAAWFALLIQMLDPFLHLSNPFSVPSKRLLSFIQFGKVGRERLFGLAM